MGITRYNQLKSVFCFVLFVFFVGRGFGGVCFVFCVFCRVYYLSISCCCFLLGEGALVRCIHAKYNCIDKNAKSH